MRSLLSVLVFLVATSSSARGADWDPSQVTVSSAEDNATLGVSGRNADVDEAGRIYLVFQKNLEAGNFQIWCSIREVDGVWGEAEIVSDPSRKARNPSASMDLDGMFHVMWEDVTDGEGDIVHRVRESDGTWGPEEFISPSAGFSKKPVIAIDAFNRLHAVWLDGRQGIQRLWYSRKPSGAPWEPARILSVGGVQPEDPTLDSDGVGNVHVVWTDRGSVDPFSFDIAYVRLDADGGGAINPVLLIDHPGVATRPFIEALDDGTLHLVWLDDRATSRSGSMEIFYKRYLPGIGWGNDKRFSYDLTDHGRPVIVEGGGTLNLVWEDFRAGTPDIYYRQITWETGWDREPTQLTSDISASQAPTLLAVPGGKLMMFWTDAQGPGTFRVFAKEGSIATP